MRSTQNNYLLDGVDNNNAQIAYQGRQGEAVKPNVDAIQEFKVMTNTFSAEYGRATGAVVNVSLKSGTNELHGSAFEFLRNEKLDAKNFFDLPNEPRPPFKRNQYGFSVGGPVIRRQDLLLRRLRGFAHPRVAHGEQHHPHAADDRRRFLRTAARHQNLRPRQLLARPPATARRFPAT